MASRIRKTTPKDNVPATKDKPDTSTTWLIDIENETNGHNTCAYLGVQTGDDVWWLNYAHKGKSTFDSQSVTLIDSLITKDTKLHRYVIVTNDEGFDAAVAFWQARGYDISRRPRPAHAQDKHNGLPNVHYERKSRTHWT